MCRSENPRKWKHNVFFNPRPLAAGNHYKKRRDSANLSQSRIQPVHQVKCKNHSKRIKCHRTNEISPGVVFLKARVEKNGKANNNTRKGIPSHSERRFSLSDFGGTIA